MLNKNDSKVKSIHLNRKALVYIRQSTLKQVYNNKESTERQYSLSKTAIEMGWPENYVEIIDEDLGMSGADAKNRSGFQRLVAEVAMGSAGIVMGLEISRLARNNADFQQLMNICGINGTLIYDADATYDLSCINDRMILGMKGTFSEVELFSLKNRLHGGLLNKAAKGELKVKLPIGLVYTSENKIILDPDKQVQDTISLFFESFQRIKTSIGVVKYFGEQGIKFPTRPIRGPHKDELYWDNLCSSMALRILHNPRYAGAFFYGRTRVKKSPSGGRSYSRNGREDWHTLLKDVHQGYINWDEFEENQKQLESNMATPLGTLPKKGSALLQGIAYCGSCGKKMMVTYRNRDQGSKPIYICNRYKYDYGHEVCTYITGSEVDKVISNILLDKVTPLAMEAALEIQAEIRKRVNAADKLLRKQVERAQYEANLAKRRVMQVDPENRLVAQSLENDWNEKLNDLKMAENEYESQRKKLEKTCKSCNDSDIKNIAHDFPKIWNAKTTSNKDRKRIIQFLIEDVILTRKDRDVTIGIKFKGGKTEIKTCRIPTSGNKRVPVPPELTRKIDKLTDEYTPGEIVNILKETNFTAPLGGPISSNTVVFLLKRDNLQSRYHRLRQKGMVTQGEIAKSLNVTIQTVRRWRKEGLINAKHYNDQKEYLYEPDYSKISVQYQNNHELIARQNKEV